MYVPHDEKPKLGDEANFIKIGVVVHIFQLQVKTSVIENIKIYIYIGRLLIKVLLLISPQAENETRQRLRVGRSGSSLYSMRSSKPSCRPLVSSELHSDFKAPKHMNALRRKQ